MTILLPKNIVHIDRLNRIFKGNYRATTGFGSQAGSVLHVNLFTAYFNFLRSNASLDHDVPVNIPAIQREPHMPAKWTTLIDMAQTYLKETQSA